MRSLGPGWLALLLTLAPGGAETLTLLGETAQISGFRQFWDRPLPEPRVFDAVHRRLLVRFPGAAAKLAEALAAGRRIDRVELLLPFERNDLWPECGYRERRSFGVDELYKSTPARWHAVARALDRAWRADPLTGPTFNAAGPGRCWAKFGAAGPGDRLDREFGPAEVSAEVPEGRLDVTAAVTDPAFGDLPRRLARLEQAGFLLRKQELWDFRFRRKDEAYEWGVACGGRGIHVGAPQLLVTLSPGPRTRVEPLPAEALATGTDRPTAVTATEAEFTALRNELGLRQPPWMPAWQWNRVRELADLGGGRVLPEDYPAYLKWLDDMLAEPPRYWNGFDAADRILVWQLYRAAVPAPIAEHWFHDYWTAWLRPELPTEQMVHPMNGLFGGEDSVQYHRRTGDWRGNCSFYRAGFCYSMSTMNFNHTAAMGALLAGDIIGSEAARADGRHGLEQWPLRTWCWFDGSTQESIDHYYFAITLSAQKMFADFGPSPLDRLMGRSILAKSIDELASTWHPGLRRFIASSGRTHLKHLFLTQDGLCHILHTLSPAGALHDLDNPNLPPGSVLIGHDLPPGRVAQQTVTGPWAPAWATHLVDDKPVPFEMTCAYKRWGGFNATPLWRRTWHGAHYGVASLDVSGGVESVPALVQWRRTPAPATTFDQVGTLVMRYGANETNLLTDNKNGIVGTQGGTSATFQHRQKLLFCTSPTPRLLFDNCPTPAEIYSLQTTLALFSLQTEPTWEVFVGGRPVEQLPVRARLADTILLRDGVTYLAFRPLPATDLGRDVELLLKPGQPQNTGYDAKSWRLAPTLLIEAYNYRSDQPFDRAGADWTRVDRAVNGFVIEVGDEVEYGSFENFARHIAAASLRAEWDEAAGLLNLVYRSGEETLECAFRPEYEGYGGRNTPTDKCFPRRLVNGQWPYLPADLDRDSSLAQQGRSGRLVKGGAVLRCRPGRMAFLQTEPVSRTVVGHNPLPDLTPWRLELPGATVETDGEIGLLQVTVAPGAVTIDQAWKSDQLAVPGRATALVLTGLDESPVTLNGRRLEGLPEVTLAGRRARVVPLDETLALDGLPARLAAARAALD